MGAAPLKYPGMSNDDTVTRTFVWNYRQSLKELADEVTLWFREAGVAPERCRINGKTYAEFQYALNSLMAEANMVADGSKFLAPIMVQDTLPDRTFSFQWEKPIMAPVPGSPDRNDVIGEALRKTLLPSNPPMDVKQETQQQRNHGLLSAMVTTLAVQIEETDSSIKRAVIEQLIKDTKKERGLREKQTPGHKVHKVPLGNLSAVVEACRPEPIKQDTWDRNQITLRAEAQLGITGVMSPLSIQKIDVHDYMLRDEAQQQRQRRRFADMLREDRAIRDSRRKSK